MIGEKTLWEPGVVVAVVLAAIFYLLSVIVNIAVAPILCGWSNIGS